jgi:hypothetical protein
MIFVVIVVSSVSFWGVGNGHFRLRSLRLNKLV